MRWLTDRHSLRRQLTLAVTVLVLLLGAVSVTGAWLIFGDFQRRVTQQDVRASVEQLVAAVQKNPSGIYLDTARIGRAYKQPLSGEYFIMAGEGWRWRSLSLWDEDLQLPEDTAIGNFAVLPGPGDQQLIALSKSFTRHGQRFVITVAKDYRPLHREVVRALVILSAGWLIALVVALIGLNFWILRSLRPLDSARRQVAEIHAGERQTLDAPVPAELVPLIGEINRLLDETRQALLRSRKALGNLGHALKTPLAVLTVLIERDEVRAQPELHASLQEQLWLISARIQRELAMDKAVPGVLDRFIPGKDLPPLLNALEKAHHRPLAVTLNIPENLSLPYDRADIIELLGNLLDNAHKWAQSRIDVAMRREAGKWLLVVADDGPGISGNEQRARVLQRGQRLDESVTGQGLGLAIVSDIIDAYGGELAFGDSPLGGLEVRVLLPARAAVSPV